MHSRAVAELQRALGRPGWLDGDNMAGYCVDVNGRHRGEALLVARPASTEEVVQVVEVCRRHALAIVPQGGNTSLCGGSVPQGRRATVVLSLARMNRVLSVDPQRYALTAEAGCTLQSLHDAAAAVDREFAMDWGARGTATVGGGISTNAGGLNVLRFGNTREQVLGLEVVLADGRVWNGLRALRKDSTGYDLKQLFIGAEGTLGVVTRAVLKLYPRPSHNQSMFAALTGVEHVNALYALARDVGDDGLTAFELVPGVGVDRVVQACPSVTRPIGKRAEWYVLLRFSGRAQVEPQLLALYERALEAGLIDDAVLAQSLAQENNLWTLRDELPPAGLFSGSKLKWDVAVPIDRTVEFLRRTQALAAGIRDDLWVYAFGHIGDGNLHLYILPGAGHDDAGFAALGERIVAEVDALAWELGGTISAEHGIGVDNRERVGRQKGALEIEMMAHLRALLDPEGLFSPGSFVEPSAPELPLLHGRA